MSAAARRLPLLWFGVLGGLGAWATHLVAGYFLIELVCDAGRGDPGMVVPAVVGLTVVLAGAAAAALAVAIRLLGIERGWRRALALGGLLLDGVALPTILLGATQLFVLPPCA